MEISPTNDPSDRMIAALAHASAIVPIASLIMPVLIWAAQRGRSPYAAFQALQAAVVQGFMTAVTTAVLIIYTLGFFLIFAAPPRVGEAIVTISSILIIATLALDLGLILYSLVAAVMVFQGKDFRYLWVGSLVDRMGRKKNQEA